MLLPEFVVRGLGSHTVGTMGADLVPMCGLVVLWDSLAKCFTDFSWRFCGDPVDCPLYTPYRYHQINASLRRAAWLAKPPRALAKRTGCWSRSSERTGASPSCAGTCHSACEFLGCSERCFLQTFDIIQNSGGFSQDVFSLCGTSHQPIYHSNNL